MDSEGNYDVISSVKTMGRKGAKKSTYRNPRVSLYSVNAALLPHLT